MPDRRSGRVETSTNKVHKELFPTDGRSGRGFARRSCTENKGSLFIKLGQTPEFCEPNSFDGILKLSCQIIIIILLLLSTIALSFSMFTKTFVDMFIYLRFFFSSNRCTSWIIQTCYMEKVFYKISFHFFHVAWRTR